MKCQHVFHKTWQIHPRSDQSTHLLTYAGADDITIALCPTCVRQERERPAGRIAEIVSVD